MAKDETRRWRGWRDSQPAAPIKGSKPTKPPGRKRKKRMAPWFWVRNKRKAQCESCGADLDVGEVVAFSRPRRLRCGGCVRKTGLTVKTSAPLAKERRERVERQLREAAGDE